MRTDLRTWYASHAASFPCYQVARGTAMTASPGRGSRPILSSYHLKWRPFPLVPLPLMRQGAWAAHQRSVLVGELDRLIAGIANAQSLTSRVAQRLMTYFAQREQMEVRQHLLHETAPEVVLYRPPAIQVGYGDAMLISSKYVMWYQPIVNALSMPLRFPQPCAHCHHAYIPLPKRRNTRAADLDRSFSPDHTLLSHPYQHQRLPSPPDSPTPTSRPETLPLRSKTRIPRPSFDRYCSVPATPRY